jgi:hypothetical protein
VVADIDQLILLLSIPKMQNLERKGWEFEAGRVLIIISYGLMNIEKRGANYRLHILIGAGITRILQLPSLGKGSICFCNVIKHLLIGQPAVKSTIIASLTINGICH